MNRGVNFPCFAFEACEERKTWMKKGKKKEPEGRKDFIAGDWIGAPWPGVQIHGKGGLEERGVRWEMPLKSQKSFSQVGVSLGANKQLPAIMASKSSAQGV